MNHIPTTFDEHQVERTVIGGRKTGFENAMNLSVILLNSSGSQFKLQVFENLVNCNFLEIISIENDIKNFSIENIAKKFPSIKFIIPSEKATDGEMINLAMSEITADYVLVLRDSLYIPSGFILQNLAKRITSEGIFCVVPWLTDKNNEGLASYSCPSAEKNHFVIDKSCVVSDGIRTLYPFNNIAIYNRQKFINIGGFDYLIKNPYWQNLDLAIRAWLWGEETKLTTMLSFTYVEETPIEDKTIDMDYLRYYLKNELPIIKNDKAYIKRSSFWKFFNHSSCGYMQARSLFKASRKWVEHNQYNFKKDLQTFIKNWKKKDEE